MDHLPINLSLKDRKVVIVGGVTVAARRTDLAVRAGADVHVFTENLGAEFDVYSGRFTHHERKVEASDLADATIAFGASEDTRTDRLLYELAKQARVPVNIADNPDLCDFIMPAILDRSPLVVSISSAGASPILARILKARLETMFPARFGRLATFAGRLRHKVMNRLKKTSERRHFFETMLDGIIADLVLAGDEEGARIQFDIELDRAVGERDDKPMGEVYVVGAGPGDPDLMTFRALRLIQRADVVLYDRLIGQGLLNLVRRDAERIYVGKRSSDHSVRQEKLSEMLVNLAKQGKRVLRLKGGDPFIFGRGGEEIEMLADAGIPFQVVPGVTAAAGCAAYAGIPLTHRDHAQAVTFVTGHAKDGKVELDWKSLIQPNHTVAIYMGLAALKELTGEFIAHGAAADLPVAVVDNGTRQSQRVVVGTLSDIADKVAAAGFEGPAVTIIGTVVTLRDKLAWFNPDRPTRSAAAASRDAMPIPPA